MMNKIYQVRKQKNTKSRKNASRNDDSTTSITNRIDQSDQIKRECIAKSSNS